MDKKIKKVKTTQPVIEKPIIKPIETVVVAQGNFEDLKITAALNEPTIVQFRISEDTPMSEKDLKGLKEKLKKIDKVIIKVEAL